MKQRPDHSDEERFDSLCAAARLRWIGGLVLLVLCYAADVAAQSLNQPPASWAREVNLELVAPPSKGSNIPWDMDVMRSPFMCVPGTPFCTGTSPLGGSEAPDMLLFILDADGGAAQYGTRPADRPRSSSPFSAIINPAEAMSMAKCPNAYVCQYQGIRVPGDTFGVVVLDQDLQSFDFMLAGIIYSTKGNQQQVDRVEKHIYGLFEELRRKGQLKGAPQPGTELPIGEFDKCKEAHPCFNDTLAGIAGVRILPAGSDMKGLPCGDGVLSGDIVGETRPDFNVAMEFRVTDNQCIGRMELVWDFGAGRPETTTETSLVYQFGKAGSYQVNVTPRCVRATRACDATTVTTRVTAAQ